MSRLLRALAPLGAAVSVALLLHACQDRPEPTAPELDRAKLPRTLTVTGGGTGVGTVTAPDVGETEALSCAIAAGTYDPIDCNRVYGWKSSVVLTATPGSNSTFSGWSGACSGTARTCKVTMVQARNVKASFAGTGVASYSLQLAGTGSGSGKVQSQGVTPAISCTITAGTPTGACSGTYPSGTSVTLSATAVTGSFDGWEGDCSGTGSCTLNMSLNRAVTVSFTAPPGAEATVGRWDPPAPTPIIGLHLSRLPNGGMLLWGHGGEPQIWNSSGGGFTQVADRTCGSASSCELFCSGHTFLADGRLLAAGGHNEALGDGNGLKQASIFNGATWSVTGSMTYARWYPTLVELENGGVVAISGTQEPGINASIPERYNGSTWTALTGAQLQLAPYPRAFLEPKNGWVFHAGASVTSRYLNPAGAGSWTTSGLGNGGSRVGGDRDYGSAVMLDSKVLYVGGGGRICPALPQNTAEMIDLSAATPTWSAVAPMAFRRRQPNATILPDGKVLVTGGSSACGATNETGAVFAAEAWDPATGRWTTWATASVVRVYHSTAALLADGRVLSTGSGDGGGATQQYTYEIFSPPYLFKGARPTYNLGSTVMHYGQPFTVTTPNATSITKATIIRLTSTTHAFNSGQQLTTLSFAKAADGQSLSLTPPVSGRKAPPGPYMLFILNDKGVPSVAQTIRLSQ